MPTPLNVLALQSATLNASANYNVTLGVSSSVTVQRNAGTPANDGVTVEFSTLAASLLSSVTVASAQLIIDGIAALNVLTTYNIGTHGVLEFNTGALNASVLSTIKFTGVGGELIIDPGLNLNLFAGISGFDNNDVLDFRGILGVDHVSYQAGLIKLFNSSNTVLASASVSNAGDLTGLGFQLDGHGGTSVGVGLGNGGGLGNDTYVNYTHDQYIVAKTQLGLLYLQDTVPGRALSVTNLAGNATISDAKYILFSDGVGRFDATGTAEQVAHLYQAAFNRTPDAVGLDAFATQIDAHLQNLSNVAQQFVNSSEFNQTYGTLTNGQFVDQLYHNVLGRAGETAGFNGWVNGLNHGLSRGDVLIGFAEGTENIIKTVSYTGDNEYGETFRLYQSALNRAPDAAGLTSWVEFLKYSGTLQQTANGFVSSAEFQNNYGAVDNQHFVDLLYNNVLHRTASIQEEMGWVNALNQGTTRAVVLLGFSDSFENRINTAASTHDNWIFLGHH